MEKIQDEFFDVEFPADAEIPTVKLTPVENMLGRWVKIPVALTAEEIVAPNGTQDLLADLYWDLYKTYPKEKDHIPEVRKVNKAILDLVKKSQDWETLRTQTTASVSMSKLCASGLIVKMLADENIQEALKKQEQAQEMQQQCQQDGANGDKKQQQQGQQKAQELINEALEGLGQNPSDQDADGDSQQQSVSKAVKEAKEDADEAKAMCKQWGMNAGTDDRLDIKEVARMKEYYERYGKVKQVTEYMGRVKGMSMATREHRSKVKGVTISRDGYTQNLQRMFPAEMTLLRKDVNPLVRAQKASEFCDRGLLGMIEETKATKSGPLVIAVDESGSMSTSGVLKAKGLALGICLSALENGQPFKVFGFAQQVLETVSSEDPRSDLMKWSTYYHNGGTNFDETINHALDIIEQSEHKYSSDFVLITDGECDVQEETEKRFKEFSEQYGTRMISFGIDTQSYDSPAFKMSDAYINVDGLENLDKLSEILTEKLIENERL